MTRKSSEVKLRQSTPTTGPLKTHSAVEEPPLAACGTRSPTARSMARLVHTDTLSHYPFHSRTPAGESEVEAEAEEPWHGAGAGMGPQRFKAPPANEALRSLRSGSELPVQLQGQLNEAAA